MPCQTQNLVSGRGVRLGSYICSQLRKVAAWGPLGEDALVQAGAHRVLLGDGRIKLALHGSMSAHRLLRNRFL